MSAFVVSELGSLWRVPSELTIIRDGSYQTEQSAMPYTKQDQNHQGEAAARAAGVCQDMKHRLLCRADLFEILNREQQSDEQKEAKGG